MCGYIQRWSKVHLPVLW